MDQNTLYFGDNLDWLDKLGSESVDLIYLDPPFNSKAEYNKVWTGPTGQAPRASVQTFEDTWTWNESSREAYDAVMAKGGPLATFIDAMRKVLSDNDIMAYIAMMAVRIDHLHRVLKNNGSIYLHCDPTASHYLKLLMDQVFGGECFRNEIIWRRTGSHNSSRRFGPVHDVILFYTKSETYTWNVLKRPFMKGHVENAFVKEGGAYKTNYSGNVLTGSGIRNGLSGLPWRGFDPTAKGRHWAVPGALLEDLDEDISSLNQTEKFDYLFEKGHITIKPGDEWPRYQRTINESDGQRLSDIWAYQPYTEGTVFSSKLGIDDDVRWMGTKDGERLKYATQKPLGILERIILSSTNEGDTVLDPFCGCGTTVYAAQALNRQWIGIDITHIAIEVIEGRMARTYGANKFKVEGRPCDTDAAYALARRDRYQFQWWATSIVGAHPFGGKKKGADRGIDGIAYFKIGRRASGFAVVQVKSDKTLNRDVVEQLRGTIEREGAAIGIFICLAKPTAGMIKEALDAGTIDLEGEKYSRMQILTIDDLFGGKKPKTPPLYKDVPDFTAEQVIKAPIKTPEEIRKNPYLRLPLAGGLAGRVRPVAHKETEMVDPKVHQKVRRG